MLFEGAVSADEARSERSWLAYLSEAIGRAELPLGSNSAIETLYGAYTDDELVVTIPMI